MVQDDDPASAASSSKRHRDDFVPRSGDKKGNVLGPVIHIQSPDPRRTYIQAGDPKGKGKSRAEAGHSNSEQQQQCQPLGIELPWVGMQLKPLGQRGMSVEFGIVDARGMEGVIRLSSYKVCLSLPVVTALMNRHPDTACRLNRVYTHIEDPRSSTSHSTYRRRINIRSRLGST